MADATVGQAAHRKPACEAAERAVLATVLTAPGTLEDVRSRLGIWDLSLESHRKIYHSMLALSALGSEISFRSIKAHLRKGSQWGQAHKRRSEAMAALLNLGAEAPVLSEAELRFQIEELLEKVRRDPEAGS